MNKSILLIILLAVMNFSYGQSQCYWGSFNINFDDTICLHRLTIDSITNPNNIWQIGKPQKPIFYSAHSSPNVIATDTVNPYPPNDTSAFIVSNNAAMGGFQFPHTALLAVYYKVNSDSLKDYGLIEFSPDNGSTWIN
ncbi:unnamed protein product, partial [marine sediment metagenome]